LSYLAHTQTNKNRQKHNLLGGDNKTQKQHLQRKQEQHQSDS